MITLSNSLNPPLFFIMKYQTQLFLLCPVPENQKSINEFFGLQQSFFFKFIESTKKSISFKENLVFLILILCFFAFLRYFSFFIIFFYSFFQFIRWREVKNRLLSSSLVYEEGSWYQSQSWEKPISLIKNERLLVYQQIQPAVQQFFQFIFFVSISSFIFLLER